MKTIKCVMSDLDGTLLEDHENVSLKSEETIRKLIDNDVEVVVATGRFLSFIPEYFKTHDGIRYLVSANGAQIYDKKEDSFIFNNTMNKDLALKVIKKAIDKTSYIAVLHEKGILIDEPSLARQADQTLDYYTTILRQHELTDRLVEHLESMSEGILKVDFGFSDEVFRNEVYDYAKSLDDITTVSSGAVNIELTASGASKGEALKFLAEHLNIETKNFLAIGDSDNDVSMIKEAGLGIAMENANEYLKSHSDAVTLRHDADGFSHAIKKFVIE